MKNLFLSGVLSMALLGTAVVPVSAATTTTKHRRHKTAKRVGVGAVGGAVAGGAVAGPAGAAVGAVAGAGAGKAYDSHKKKQGK